jgi:hypothetical protein
MPTRTLLGAHLLSQLPGPQGEPQGSQHHQPHDELQDHHGTEPNHLDKSPVKVWPPHPQAPCWSTIHNGQVGETIRQLFFDAHAQLPRRGELWEAKIRVKIYFSGRTL